MYFRTYEKAVILNELNEIMQREQNANQYLFINKCEILDVQIDNMIDLLDLLHEEKKELLNYLQSVNEG
ncbi:hypothetical protein [Inediibacterium massiliense]|uniref:hypothetical protein n=1 Tax=Inediibacterium massiliense TaxID=1658111 RepID=UPI0006B58587|nr:hypothetical protein [Inediibacterium massiliense]